MGKRVPTLNEWESANPVLKRAGWVDQLPEHIKAQIRDSETSVARIVQWLHDIGYPEATDNRVERYRRLNRDRRTG